MPTNSGPTVVLVHGAFADASGWRDVADNLRAQGYSCYAPANPLRGVRPDAEYLLGTPSGAPGWRTVPSWSLVAGNDATIPPEAERAMAARAGATVREVPSSHVAMISHPAETTEVIVEALKATA